MRSDLEPRLRGLYRTPADGQAAHARAHEDELVAAALRRGGGVGAGSGGRTRGWTSWLRLPRLALAGVLGVALAVGACVMPAEYPVSLGYELEVTLPVERWAELDHETLSRHLDAWPGVEHVEIRMQHVHERTEARGRAAVDTDEARMQLFVFGDALDPDALLADLQARFPVLEGAELRDVPLSGTVHGTFGGALSHRYLDVVIDRHGVEEAERQLLAALAAEGISTESTRVDIIEERGANGEHRIEVRVQAEHHEPAHAEPEP